MSSCQATTFYQICKVESELPTSVSGGYEWKGSDCDISYDFWADGGAVRFTVTNNTDKFIYVDLSKSFFIRNGVAYDYFLNRTTSAGASVASTQSASSGGSLSFWSYLGKKSVSAASASSVASQRAVSCTFGEKEVAAVPPHASKVFSEYAIMSGRFTDCDLYESPGKRERASMSFDVSSTPVRFTNYVCYRVGEGGSDRFVENGFYVSEVCNQHHDATFHKVAGGCPSDVYRPKEDVFVRTSPKEFYVSYSPRAQKPGMSRQKSARDDVYGF